ncbi:MAG: helix-turn-helix transcriptional regulator [Burkholderiales bacterium]|nr:helix-turn-helix transcriptional regulator [Burkholderiales bacterium]
MVEPLAAQLAWLDGRTGEAIARWQDALSHEQAIDVLGQASEVRLRLARALARDQRAGDAEALLRETVARAREDEGPGGALLAPDALRELCEAPGVDAGLRAQLRAWCGCLDAACRTQCARDDATPAGDAKERPAPAVALSPREVEVLARIAAGDGNKQIARSLDLSLHTVKRHVANILAKLDVASRGQAAHWYRTHGS